MNIQFQLCGLFILILFFVFYKSHKTLQLYKERLFYEVLCTLIIVLILDISSLIAINERASMPLIMVNAVCKMYLMSLIWATRSALVYILTDILPEKEHRKITTYITVITIVQSIMICPIPIYIFDEAGKTYTYGPVTIFVYICVALYMVSIIGLTMVFYKKINPRRAFAVIIWMIIWTVAAAIQFFYSELLIVGFAGAMGVVILFVIMENPEANLDRELACFNSYAMGEYITSLMEHKQEFEVLEVTFDETNTYDESIKNIDQVVRELLSLVKHYDDVFVFKKINLGFILVSVNSNRISEVGKQIEKYVCEKIDSAKSVSLVLIPQTGRFETKNELFRFLNFIDDEYVSKRGKLLVVNDDIIGRYQEYYLVEKEVRNALKEDRVEVFLQPIYSTHEKYFNSAEALVRIRKKSGDLLSPAVFIPIAEKTGQILELGERVFEKVCGYIRDTDALSYGLKYIEVNLSVVQCEQTDLPERRINIVEKYGVDASQINLEITETAAIGERDILIKNMHRLIEYGFTFSLDDFGKGESNLMYIVEMPVSIVKLDYDMSKAFFTSPKARQVVSAVVGMAHGMELKLVAEGIETKEEAESMHNEKIDYIQGYYYSKPLPMPEALVFLRKMYSEMC